MKIGDFSCSPEQKQLTNKIQKDENEPRHNHVKSATWDPMKSRKLTTSLGPPENNLFSMMSNLYSDKQKQGGNKNVAFETDLKNEPMVAKIAGVGQAKSTEGPVVFGQTFDNEVVATSTVKSSAVKGTSGRRNKKGKGRKK